MKLEGIVLTVLKTINPPGLSCSKKWKSVSGLKKPFKSKKKKLALIYQFQQSGKLKRFYCIIDVIIEMLYGHWQ